MTALARSIPRVALAVACLLAAGLAHAQQRPLTGQMLGDGAPPHPGTVPATPVSPAPPPPPRHVVDARLAAPPATLTLPIPARAQIGDTTRALLQLQAGGAHAGARLPILGDQATLSYARYLQSFTHPIPEYLDTSVRKQISGDGSSGSRSGN